VIDANAASKHNNIFNQLEPAPSVPSNLKVT